MIVSANFPTFASREISLRNQIASAIAARDSLPVDDPRPRTAEVARREAESRALDEVAAWGRAPREPADDIERLCAAIFANAAECDRQRQERIAARAAVAAANAPPPDEAFVLTVRDELTRQLVRIELPAGAARIVEHRGA